MLRSTIEKIISMSHETSSTGWDDEGGVPIGPEEWLFAVHLYAKFDEAGMEPFISPCGDGSVHFSVFREGKSFDVEFRDRLISWTKRPNTQTSDEPVGARMIDDVIHECLVHLGLRGEDA